MVGLLPLCFSLWIKIHESIVILMLAVTRRSARRGSHDTDKIDLNKTRGINFMPTFSSPIGDALEISNIATISVLRITAHVVVVERLRPAICFLIPKLVAGLEGINHSNIGRSTGPTNVPLAWLQPLEKHDCSFVWPGFTCRRCLLRKQQQWRRSIHSMKPRISTI